MPDSSQWDDIIGELPTSGTPRPEAGLDQISILVPLSRGLEFPPEEDDLTAVREVVSIATSDTVDLTVREYSPAEGYGTEEVMRDLRVLMRSANALGRGIVRLYPLLGQVLVQIERNALWREMGFSSFNSFCESLEPLGLSRGTRIRAITLAKEFSSVSGEEVQKIGLVNIMDMRKVYPGGEKVPEVKKIIDDFRDASPVQAQAMRQDLRRQIIDTGLETGRTLISIFSTKEVADDWREFVATPEIQAYCETDSPGFILRKMMQECQAEWQARINDQRRRRYSANDDAGEEID